MEVRAISKSVRMGPRKIRLVADMIRHLSIDSAIRALQASDKRAAIPLEKTLMSAVANAVNNSGVEKDSLLIESINITDGTSLKRFHPSTRGRVHPYKRRSSHIRIVLKTKKPKTIAKKTEEKKIDETKKVEEKTSPNLKAKEVKKGKK